MHVTKGSFIGTSRIEKTLEAMLQEWETRETDDIIKQVEVAGGDASAKLLNLFQLAYEDDGQLRRQCGLGQQMMQNRYCDRRD